MLSALCLFLSIMLSVFRSGAALQVKNLALRHQIGVFTTLSQETDEVDPGGPSLSASRAVARRNSSTTHESAVVLPVDRHCDRRAQAPLRNRWPVYFTRVTA